MEQLGWLIFLVALLFSVMLHETGHFVMAKRFGMKAPQFFVGFGPTLWSTKVGGTEYGLKAIPLGGYTKIVGMTALAITVPTRNEYCTCVMMWWLRPNKDEIVPNVRPVDIISV